MSKTIRLFAALAISTIAFAACSDSSGTGTGLLTVRLTDAPFPFSEVASVDVFVIRVDAKSAATTDVEAANEADHAGWTTVAEPNASINLLDLGSGKTVKLGATTLATGNYRSFRLILDTDKTTITLKDGTGTKPVIFFPSAGRTGIKINLDGPIELTENGVVMTLDFDIGRSFVMRGNSAASGFNFKPVIRAVDITGSVTGSVHAINATGAVVPDATVEVLTAGTPLTDINPTHIVRSATTDANGNFRIAFLPPGSYVLRATPPAVSGFQAALLTGGLTITAGTETQNQIIVVAR